MRLVLGADKSEIVARGPNAIFLFSISSIEPRTIDSLGAN